MSLMHLDATPVHRAIEAGSCVLVSIEYKRALKDATVHNNYDL